MNLPRPWRLTAIMLLVSMVERRYAVWRHLEHIAAQDIEAKTEKTRALRANQFDVGHGQCKGVSPVGDGNDPKLHQAIQIYIRIHLPHRSSDRDASREGDPRDVPEGFPMDPRQTGRRRPTGRGRRSMASSTSLASPPRRSSFSTRACQSGMGGSHPRTPKRRGVRSLVMSRGMDPVWSAQPSISGEVATRACGIMAPWG